MAKSCSTPEAKRAITIEIINYLQTLPNLIEDGFSTDIIYLINFIFFEFMPEPWKLSEDSDLIKIRSMSEHGVEVYSDRIGDEYAELSYEIAKKIAQDAGYAVSLHGNVYKA